MFFVSMWHFPALCIWPVSGGRCQFGQLMAGEELDFVCETDTRLLLCGLNSGPNKDVSRMKAVVATKNTANCMILFSFWLLLFLCCRYDFLPQAQMSNKDVDAKYGCIICVQTQHQCTQLTFSATYRRFSTGSHGELQRSAVWRRQYWISSTPTCASMPLSDVCRQGH